ncbi:MAG: DUF561 domain-containing protein [Deltaproteobacteria bacterium]|nr:MAG: DUF561 domain-containing protein [Deltaproteobacteria bacterium]
MKNALTDLLGIEYPIIQGGMMAISGAELAAAVSNAGGLGVLGQKGNSPDSLPAWRDEIRKTRALTDKPFAVNLPIHVPFVDEALAIVFEEAVPVVATAAGNPLPVLPRLKEHGVKVMHVVSSVKLARRVAEAGVDAIVAEGGESGGLVARDRVSTMVLVPMVVDAVSLPVVAAGGIADARGFLAALALGAQGVQMGTRFLVTRECTAADDQKEAIISAQDTDTRVVPMGRANARMLKEELHPQAMAGQIGGMITSVETVGEIITRITTALRSEFDRLAAMI